MPPGPPPKDPRVRQRRNKVATEAHVEDENPIRDDECPPLPNFGNPDDDWLPETLEYWAEIWASPIRDEFIRADVPRLVLYMRLYDAVNRGNMSLAQEMRLQGQCLGLTPYDRRRLGWVVSKKAGPKAPARTPTERKRGHDTRAVLRAVT